MKKSIIIIKKIIMTLIIITLSILLANRMIYGTYNVFGTPTRIDCGYHRYMSVDYIVTLKGKDKPTHEISGAVDKITGKKIYYIKPDYLEPGGAIYLHLNGDRYLVFGYGGGA